jgi:hypothetical protein
VRFLGRKVYAGVIVVLVSAMMHGPNEHRLKRLQQELGESLWCTADERFDQTDELSFAHHDAILHGGARYVRVVFSPQKMLLDFPRRL